MTKLAVFVEGNTELLFVTALVEEIAGAHNVRIEQRRIRGGTKTHRTMALVKAANQATGQNHFLLLFDCGGDDAVKDRIREEHENLTRKHYAKIIGMRDVRPKYAHAEIPKLEAGLQKYIKTSLIPVQFVLSVMEIEAWFLAEFNHYPKIDPAITLPAIRHRLGFDPEHDDMTQRPTPSDDLNACYMIAGKTYEKKKAATTVAALDYAFLYLEQANRIEYLRKLVDVIDEFLT